jgi:hypothetical protein
MMSVLESQVWTFMIDLYGQTGDVTPCNQQDAIERAQCGVLS